MLRSRGLQRSAVEVDDDGRAGTENGRHQVIRYFSSVSSASAARSHEPLFDRLMGKLKEGGLPVAAGDGYQKATGKAQRIPPFPELDGPDLDGGRGALPATGEWG